MDDQPIVYFKPGCPFGVRLRTALTLHRVPHRSVSFRDDEGGAARVRDVNDGNEISPTVHIAGRWLTNPGWREVKAIRDQLRRIPSSEETVMTVAQPVRRLP